MFATKDAVFSSPCVGQDGTVYIASWDQHLYAIDARAGGAAPRWKPALKEVVPAAKKAQSAQPKVADAAKKTKPVAKVERAPRRIKEIKAIEFEITPTGEERIIVTLNEAVQPQFFTLDGGRPRLVCDFYGAYLKGGIPPRIKVKGNVIKQIRIGFYRGAKSKVRIVLDLEVDKDYDARQTLSQDEGRYIITVKPALDENSHR
jgi:hypothetical protein